MDEDQFRKTYKDLNPQRCVFEKAINNRRCNCSYKHIFLLATREGVACTAEDGSALCSALLNKMRQASSFHLKSITVGDSPLPHNQELRIQAGGISGLRKLVANDSANNDIYSVLQSALAVWKDVEHIPYSEIINSISNYKVRSRRTQSDKGD